MHHHRIRAGLVYLPMFGERLRSVAAGSCVVYGIHASYVCRLPGPGAARDQRKAPKQVVRVIAPLTMPVGGDPSMVPSTDTVALRATQKLIRDLGPLAMEALRRPGCRELIRNADGALWFEGLQTGMVRIGTMSHAQAEAVVKTVAGYHGKEATRATPIVEGELPFDGSRFAGQLPPIVSSPTFAIRKKAIAIYTLDQYVASGTMTALQREAIGRAVRGRNNILVVGGTGSGKTTLVNAVIQDMVVATPTDRLCIIEDTGELQCTAENYVQYHTSLSVSMTQLLRLILRMRPERILVGEVRGGEALDLLDAWSTGHPGGAATLHANSALAGLTRLNSLVTRNEAGPTDINKLIGEAIHVVVYIARTPQGRRVEEVVTLDGFRDGQFIVKANFAYEVRGPS